LNFLKLHNYAQWNGTGCKRFSEAGGLVHLSRNAVPHHQCHDGYLGRLVVFLRNAYIGQLYFLCLGAVQHHRFNPPADQVVEKEVPARVKQKLLIADVVMAGFCDQPASKQTNL